MKNSTNFKNEMLLSLGVTIRKLRLRKGFRSAELFSYENNLNRTAYWRWENGQNITMKNFFKICSIHNISPKDIFEIMENKFDDKITNNILFSDRSFQYESSIQHPESDRNIPSSKPDQEI